RPGPTRARLAARRGCADREEGGEMPMPCQAVSFRQRYPLPAVGPEKASCGAGKGQQLLSMRDSMVRLRVRAQVLGLAPARLFVQCGNKLNNWTPNNWRLPMEAQLRPFIRAVVCSVGLLQAMPVAAQSEQQLRQAFEGHFVIVRMDMPATEKGVDLHPGR